MNEEMQTEKTEEASVGGSKKPVDMKIVLLIFIAVLVFMGIHAVKNAKYTGDSDVNTAVPAQDVEDAQPAVDPPLSDSTDLDDIESDLDASGLEDLDAELKAIEQELNF